MATGEFSEVGAALIAIFLIFHQADDVKFLVPVGLVETMGNRALAPRVDYDEIQLKIAV